MNRNKYLKYFAVLFLVTSCATTSVVVDPFDSSKTYMSDMDTQWKKLVRFFSTNQIGIGTLEKDSGIITVNTIPYLLTPLLFLFNPSTKIFAILFLFTSSMLLSNGMFHIGVASAQTDYSPGLITSLFMYIPLYIKALSLASERVVPIKMQIALTIYGSIAHFLMLWLINIF